MTPNNNAPNGLLQQANGRKRSLAGPSRVAIPLPLSRPRPAKPQPRPEKSVTDEIPATKSSAYLEAEAKGQDAPAAEELNKTEKTAEAPTVLDTSEVVESKVDEESQPASQPSETEPLINGEEPEKAQETPELPALSVQAARGAANPSTSSATRKPANIRTELPPAFVPAGQHTPHSASSLQINRNSQVFQPQSHLSRPSTSSIVFGGEDSGTSSPAPPHSAGSGFVPPSGPPAHRTQPPPPFVPANHAHHYSEPQAYHPQQQWNYQRQYNPTPHQPPGFHSHAHAHFRYPPREPFVPAETLQLNGHASRSASPSSATASDAQRYAQELQSPVTGDRGSDGARYLLQEPKAAFPGQHAYRPHPFQRNMQQQAPDFRSDSENGQQLREHILSHFADPSLSDCHLQITLEVDGSRQYIDGHKLILARSPTLLDRIRKAGDPATASAKTQVEISLQGKYVTLKTFSDCLRYIYGGPILPFANNTRHTMNSPDGMPSNGELMEEALQYVATSAWLRLHAPAVRGVEVAVSLLHWDTLASALGFALEGGLSPNWTLDDGSTDRSSTTSSDDSLEAATNPTFDPYSTELLKHILHFTVTTFPQNFYIDTSAAQLSSSPRLPNAPPTHERSKPSTSANPRLSELRFGDHPVNKPTQMTTSISSLLFSLPFPLLKFLLEHPILAERLGGETVASIIRQVVSERESRREKAVKARSAAPAAGTEAVSAQVLANLNWIESTETTNHGRVGLRLVRRRKGLDTPASSGAEDA